MNYFYKFILISEVLQFEVLISVQMTIFGKKTNINRFTTGQMQLNMCHFELVIEKLNLNSSCLQFND